MPTSSEEFGRIVSKAADLVARDGVSSINFEPSLCQCAQTAVSWSGEVVCMSEFVKLVSSV